VLGLEACEQLALVLLVAAGQQDQELFRDAREAARLRHLG
jgi:hypothetical protein